MIGFLNFKGNYGFGAIRIDAGLAFHIAGVKGETDHGIRFASISYPICKTSVLLNSGSIADLSVPDRH